MLVLSGILSAALISIPGCDSGSDTASAPEKPATEFPATDATHDSSYKGVYKGVFTGSSGNFRLSIYNDDPEEVSLSFTFDGTNVIVTGTETANGENRVFTFSRDGYIFAIEIDPAGTVISAELTVPGHAGAINVIPVKENSAETVYCYEGTGSGSIVLIHATYGELPLNVSVIWNCTINPYDMTYKGYAIKTLTHATYGQITKLTDEISGSVSGNTITVADSIHSHSTGNVTSDRKSVSGTWTINENTVINPSVTLKSGSGNWSGTAKFQ